MKILVISQFFPPDITAAAFRVGESVRILKATGNEVVVLAGMPHKSRNNQHPLNDEDDFVGIQVERCNIRELGDFPSKKNYILHYMSFVLSSFGKGMKVWWKGFKPDVIYVSSPPLFVGMASYLLSWIFWKPIVFEVRDIWPDSAVAAGQLSKGGIAYRVGRFLERFFYARSAEITCVATPMKRYIESQTNRPVTVVYNGVPEAMVDRIESTETKKETKVLMYAGNFGSVQNLDLAIQGFAELKSEGLLDGWSFRLVGTGVRENELLDQISNLNMTDHIKLLPPVPKNDVFRVLSCSSVLYLSLVSSSVLEHTIPSKIFDYMALAKPILAGLRGEGAEILSHPSCNQVFEPGDLSGFKSAMQELAIRLPFDEEILNQNRAILREQFTREANVKKLEEVFGRVCNP